MAARAPRNRFRKAGALAVTSLPISASRARSSTSWAGPLASWARPAVGTPTTTATPNISLRQFSRGSSW
jgi:hypothetical protein